jgi:ribosomal protein S18 acetylase RimI-like enzyme
MSQNGDTTPIIIRPATPDDARNIAELHIRSWQWAYRNQLPDEYLQHIASKLDARTNAHYNALAHPSAHQRRWIAEYNNAIAGFACTNLSHDPDATPETAQVEALYLAPEAAGKGIGRALFSYTVDDLRRNGYVQATLWVLKTNQRARKFYESAGWLPDGQVKVEERPGAILHEVRYHMMF